MAFVKHIHLTFVALSILGFVIRGIWMIKDSPLLQAKLVKIFPHVVDTILLVSAVVLAVQLGLNPVHHPWLMTKIVLLVVYIVLGTIALKPTRPKKIRIIAFCLAIVCFVYIASAAVSKSPLGFLSF